MPSVKSASFWGNFTPVSDQPNYRLIYRSYGPEKSGKDHFGLTMPGPIAIQSFDIGLEGVVEKFLRAPLGPKEIVATDYQFDKNNCKQSDAETLRDQFVEDYELALRNARSIIWDTETELWELFRYAEFGEASDAPKNYVALNAAYRDLVQRAYDTGVNLQLIQKVKEKWISVESTDRNNRPISRPQPTGQMEPTGFKEAGYIVQANLRHSWTKEQGFVVEVLNCRQNMEVAGEVYTGGVMDFPTLGQSIFPESDASDWV